MNKLANIFNRRRHTGGSTLNPRVYNLVIGLMLLWGFFLNFLSVKYIPTETLTNIPFIGFIVGYIVSCLIGIFLLSSKHPLVSFIGYNFIAVPIGFVVNMIVSRHNPDIVIHAIMGTGFITAGMMILGTLFPNFFKKIVNMLTISLILVIIFEMISIFVFGKDSKIFDVVVILIFSGYIGYDWGRANSIPKTLDNAIDSAAALYLDIINIFIRLVSLMDND